MHHSQNLGLIRFRADAAFRFGSLTHEQSQFSDLVIRFPRAALFAWRAGCDDLAPAHASAFRYALNGIPGIYV
jgi:hypothetical protein